MEEEHTSKKNKKDSPAFESLKYSHLVSMYFAANGFRYNYNSLMKLITNKLGIISYENLVVVAATNGFFAAELYLKLIYGFDYWDKSEKGKDTPQNLTQYPKGHHLNDLFKSLEEDSKSCIKKAMSSKLTEEQLSNFLEIYKKGFEDWRYFFEKKNKIIETDFDILKSFLSSLYHFSRSYIEKYPSNYEWSNDIPISSVTMVRKPVSSREEAFSVFEKSLGEIYDDEDDE